MKDDCNLSDDDKVSVTIWLSSEVIQWFQDKAQDSVSFQDLISAALEAHIRQQTEGSSHKRKSYKLAELLAGCDPDAPMPDEVREWDNMPPVGNEIL